MPDLGSRSPYRGIGPAVRDPAKGYAPPVVNEHMKMKIDSGVPSSTPVTRASEIPGRAGAISRTPVSAAGDSVEITSLSARLNELEGVLAGVPVVDSAQVQAIKDAISEGRFQVDSEVVADRLLSSVKELLLQRGRT